MVTSRYETRTEAEADSLFGRGWLPDIIPQSSINIVTKNDLDLNTSRGEFSFADEDLLQFLSHLTRRKKLDSGRYIAYSFKGWVFLIDHKNLYCRYYLNFNGASIHRVESFKRIIGIAGLVLLLAGMIYYRRRRERRLAEGWKIVESRLVVVRKLQGISGLVIGACLGAMIVVEYNVPTEYFLFAFLIWLFILKTKWQEPEEEVILKGTDLFEQDSAGRTALFAAAEKGDLAKVERMIFSLAGTGMCCQRLSLIGRRIRRG